MAHSFKYVSLHLQEDLEPNFHRFRLEVLIDFKPTPWIDDMFGLTVATLKAYTTA